MRISSHQSGCACCFIVPPHMLNHLAREGDPRLKLIALNALLKGERLRTSRIELTTVQRNLKSHKGLDDGARRALSAGLLGTTTSTTLKRTIFDADHGTELPGKPVRNEGSPATTDISVNEAYDQSGIVYNFYKQIFGRNSVDGNGLPIKSSVHYDNEYDNAFWNGRQMVYGDGDGQIFDRFTKCLDVIGHELTHGVTQFEAALNYQDQPGALNESISDVFGSLVKQWHLNQTADEADWLIGEGLFKPGVKGVALRSMKAPGTAYDDPQLGKDPQPATMAGYDRSADDNGGVHINSGIPNHAFYLTAVGIGGAAWEKAGQIWYDALCSRLKPDADFAAAKTATVASAKALFGAKGAEAKAVQSAWAEVGV